MTKTKDYFKAICKVSRTLGETLVYEEVLNIVVESAVKTMEGKAAALFLKNEAENIFEPAVQTGLSEAYLHAEPEQARKSADDVIETGYLSVTDAQSDSRVSNHEAKKKEGIASILVVPVRVKGAVIGILTLYTAEKREFSEDEADFLSALAEQGGMAIDNAKLFKRIRSNSRLFLKLAENIGASLDIKVILTSLTEDLAKAFGMKGVIIRLLDKDKNVLKNVAQYGLSQEFLDKGPVFAKKNDAEVLKGNVTIIKNVADDASIQYPAELKKEGIGSIMTVPIKVGDEVLGIMRFLSATVRDFPDDVVNMAKAIATQGGIAIKNAYVYLTLEEDMKSLQEDVWSHRLWF